MPDVKPRPTAGAMRRSVNSADQKGIGSGPATATEFITDTVRLFTRCRQPGRGSSYFPRTAGRFTSAFTNCRHTVGALKREKARHELMSAFVKCGHFDAELGWNVPDRAFRKGSEQ